jgi:CRP-like cAMP-binding protein
LLVFIVLNYTSAPSETFDSTVRDRMFGVRRMTPEGVDQTEHAEVLKSLMAGAKEVSVPNRVLAALPRKDYQKLLPSLETVALGFGDILYQAHGKIRYMYFPNDSFVSMLTSVDVGHAVEVGLIGSEGMIGVPMALGVAVSPFRAVVQGGGTALRMTTEDFRRNFRQSAALKREVFLFTHLLMIQIAQTAACNRFHVVAQRMARWMLMTRDRVNSNEFRITQEFLALMLGVRRVGVSLAMVSLRERKLIDYRKGTITILDHGGLVASACGCYKTVKDIYTEAQAQ